MSEILKLDSATIVTAPPATFAAPGESSGPKVAHITTVDVSLFYLLHNQMQTLSHSGFEVCGISAPGEAVTALVAAGIRHVPVAMSRSISPLADLVSLARLVAVLRRERFDIVHTHTPKAGLLGQLAARIAGVPVVINTVHGFYFHERMSPLARRFYIALERIAARCSSVILSQNQEDLDTAVRERICPQERIEFLGNGIDLTQFDPTRFSGAEEAACRAALGLAPGAPVIGFVGRLAGRRKGFLDFLAAAQALARELPEARFLIIGEADRGKPDAVEPSAAEAFGIADRCIFLGHRENGELPLLYRAMDVLVLPSLFEGVPRVVMEASAMGLPAVVSDVKGNREAVEEGRNGLRVPFGDVPALSAAILRVVREPELAPRMGEAGRQIAAERFDERLVFAKVTRAYTRLLREKGRPLPVARQSSAARTRAPGDLQVLSTSDATAWHAALGEVVQHDFHHLAEYHRAAEQGGEGTAKFFVYREAGHLLALPLLLRPIGGAAGAGWNDATSVYGYGGPLSSRGPLPLSVLENFRAALRRSLLDCRVIAAFSRLHPLIEDQDRSLAGLGECVPGGTTVSLDLTLPVEAQRAQYRETYKRRLNKLRRAGVVGSFDGEKRHLTEFIALYLETMQRVEAHHSYYFDEQYFRRLVRELGPVLHLCVARLGDRVIAAGLFTLCDGIVQYHLGGTRDEFLELSPMALVIDTARDWGVEQGARALHLGGGVGAKEDGVFNFKAGFSDRRHTFATWRWIVEPQIYRSLCAHRLAANQRAALQPVSTAYFPAYRCPTEPRATL